MRLTLLSAFLLSVATSAVADEGASGPSDVLELTADSFDKTVSPADLMLVEFFAPWCGHCKALAPHYEEAATALKAKNIPIAKVDCVAHAELCNQHGVTGYPTLKVFRNGTPVDYNGPRKADGIISYMVKQSLPAVAPVTAENHDEFKGADKVVIVLYASSTTDAPVAAFSKAAEKHRDDWLFGLASDSAAIQAAGVKSPSLVVYKKFDDGKDVYPDAKLEALTVEALEGWLKDVGTPLMDEISGENYSAYAESGLPLAYLFLDPTKDDKEELIKAYKPLAKKYKNKVNFVWIDALKFAEHGKAMNLQEPKWPAFVIQDMEKQLKYPHDQDADINTESVDAHVDQYLAGVLEPKLKSEAIPETQDESVFVLVTKQFDQVVFDDSKDVFVEFYAPWCGHCKRLKPTWDELGDKFADVKDRVTIAKMDATENDLPPSVPFRVNGFPTLKFKKAGSKEFIDYEGDRSLDSLVEFVKKHASNDLTPKETTSSAVPPVETVAQQEEDKQKHVEL